MLCICSAKVYAQNQLRLGKSRFGQMYLFWSPLSQIKMVWLHVKWRQYWSPVVWMEPKTVPCKLGFFGCFMSLRLPRQHTIMPDGSWHWRLKKRQKLAISEFSKNLLISTLCGKWFAWCSYAETTLIKCWVTKREVGGVRLSGSLGTAGKLHIHHFHKKHEMGIT